MDSNSDASGRCATSTMRWRRVLAVPYSTEMSHGALAGACEAGVP